MTRVNETLIKIRPIRAFNDNYIWLIDDGVNAAVVDPGQAQPVLKVLERDGLSLTAILLTHHHADHVGGVEELLRHQKVPVYGPATESIKGCDHPLDEGDKVVISKPQLSFEVLDVPGHTAGHIAFYGVDVGGEPALFCGDTLFVMGCGRIFEGTPAQMLASLDKLCALPDDTRVYCAHEYTQSNVRWALAVDPDNTSLQAFSHAVDALREADKPTVPSKLGQEKRCNPFLRSRDETVARSAAQWAGHALVEPVDVFAALRNWKNKF